MAEEAEPEPRESNSQDGGANPQLPPQARPFESNVTWGVSSLVAATPGAPGISPSKNHTATLVGRDIFIFGGYDGLKNHSDLYVFNVDTMRGYQPKVEGEYPSGRNGHTATLLPSQKILILGGWLGNGPLAASCAYFLDTQRMEWVPPTFTGDPPGPCNMHTADLVGSQLFVFRGGDGRAYLNDLHALDLVQDAWHPVLTSGERPPQRANHCSVVETKRDLLYVFGGWDGTKRLNDLYQLDVSTLVWSLLTPYGIPPQPRAGTTLSYIRVLLFMFGGSGHSTRCFNDIHVYDPEKNTWFVAACDRDEPGGTGPCEKRAGHAAVPVGRKVLIFGGACGTQYFGRDQVYEIDTDAPPEVSVASQNLVNAQGRQVLGEMLEARSFTDVTFVVEGREIAAHRVLLALFSDHFRAMFSAGMRESFENRVPIQGVPYDAFRALLSFLYSGQLEDSVRPDAVSWYLDLLLAADQFCVEPLKAVCEDRLVLLVTEENVETILAHADLAHAAQLRAYCDWTLRQKHWAAEPSNGAGAPRTDC